ncbi:MAG: UDP-N-acetylmuramoyl-tripeptide--D-alanyl-D-alanine ligase [Rubrivivax sp.]|nr:UDP-N-acetylmuramoyl-tripeptide--D-alanyl-D-alanine ligase [Rubrivivax sp.]
MMSLDQALQLVPGAERVGDGHTSVLRVHSDTRSLQPGDLFVALKGERFDAHDYLAQARAAGAVAALAERGLGQAGLPGLLVKDSLAALQSLAAGWRRQFVLPLIAVTGSNGKTTVTQMIAAILRAAQGEAALATSGNLNNHIGVPLTLLRLRPEHRIAVLELGMNHPGEIAVLAGMAAPTVALVNNAQREHQEFMVSVAAVAQENGAAIEALPADGVAVFPSDDGQALVWRQQAARRRRLTFALDAPADVTALQPQVHASGWSAELSTPAGRAPLQLRMAGRHNLKNALAATAAALAAGVSLDAVVQGLSGFSPIKGRSQLGLLQLDGRVLTLVDDSYNANPDSVLAAIDVLASLPAPRWLVLGDMAEVGSQGRAFHAEVGTRAFERGLEHLWCAGIQTVETARAFGRGARHFATVDSLLDSIRHRSAFDPLPPAAAVLVKGSRSMAMERVVQALQAASDTPEAPRGGES